MLLTVLILGILLRSQANHSEFWILAWPGTIFHELSHYLVGMILGARPTTISLVPSAVESTGWQTHGYVEFDNLNWFNALPTALAPMLGFVAALAVGAHLSWNMTWSNLALWWICVALVSQSWPSRTDWRAAFSSWPGIAFYSSLSAAVVWW